VGRSQSRRSTISIAKIRPLGTDAPSRQAAAESHLQALVEVFQRGMCEPLPLYLRTSAAWASAAIEGNEPGRAAGAEWVSGYDFPKEDKEPEHVLVLGGAHSFTVMVDGGGAPLSDEVSWDPSEPTRFGAYAHRMWDGLLAHEEVVDR
jgi:exodeoxyribonuclease V gamma subunit